MKTSLNALLNIAVRLGAVLLAVHTVEQAPSIAYDLAHTHDWPWGSLSFGMLGLLLASALWVKPGLLTFWAVGSHGPEVFETPLDAFTLQHIAFAVTGIWLAVTGLTGIIGHLITIGMLRDVIGSSGINDQWIWVVRYLVTGVAGVVLVLGARGLATWLDALRTRGMPSMPPEEDPRES